MYPIEGQDFSICHIYQDHHNKKYESSLIPTDGRNIQFKQLESIAVTFGKSGPVIPSNRIQGYIVTTVENRNHIAHGDETPGEVGARITKKDIEENFTSMEELSEYIINQYDLYVKNKEFLKSSVR